MTNFTLAIKDTTADGFTTQQFPSKVPVYAIRSDVYDEKVVGEVGSFYEASELALKMEKAGTWPEAYELIVEVGGTAFSYMGDGWEDQEGSRRQPGFTLTPSNVPNRELMVKLVVPEKALMDILTTAVEGGSAYWLMADSVERALDLSVTRIVKPMDKETGEVFTNDMFQSSFKYRDIDSQTVFMGLERLAQGALPGRGDLRAKLMDISRGNEDFDADDCDVIVQLGFFGDVIFG